MDKFNWFAAIFAAICTFFNFIFGGWDIVLIVLIAFIILDYLTGVINAIISKSLSSEIGAKGIAKKAVILIVLIVAVLLDRLVNGGQWIFRTLVCYFYIANEGISLLENVTKIGVPVPEKIKQILLKINK